MAYTIPPDTRVAGDSGHVGDHNDMVDVFHGMYSGVYNVLNTVYAGGADPTGAADSTAAIQAALNAAVPGAAVYLPPGVFATTAPLTVPPGVALVSSAANEVATSLDFDSGGVIQPSGSFSQGSAAGNAVILVVGQATGGYSTVSEEQKITSIMIDGSKLPAGNTVDGIQFYGNPRRCHLHRVLVATVGGNGISCVEDGSGNLPDALRCERVDVRYIGLSGFNIYRVSDCTFTDCLAENCTGAGWTITNASNGTYVSCRSEHNATGFAYVATVNGSGSGGAKFIGCSTDYSTGHGFDITSTATPATPVLLSGCAFRRDGANGGSGGGGYAGLHVHGFPSAVQVSGCTVFPGVSDTGTGTNAPQYGMLLAGGTAGSSFVLVSGSYIQGATTAVSTDGTTVLQYDAAVVLGTGATTAPVLRSYPGMSLQATTGAGGYTLANATGTVVSWTAPNDGELHRVFLTGECVITSAETGGAVDLSYTPPSGSAQTVTLLAGGAAAGVSTLNSGAGVTVIVGANTTVAINQTSALTAGAATLYAEIWGS